MTTVNHAATLFQDGELARAALGVLVRRSGRLIRSVSIDSRVSRESCLFVPLKGERVDGHDFIPPALARGAAAVLVRAEYWRAHEQALAGLLDRADATGLVVEDTLAALQALARFHLARFPKLFRVGVTGSNGKTTTKELIGAVLAQAAPTMTSEGNLNSEIGVPLSAFAVNGSHRYAVFEMGVNHPGEMDALASIVRPNLAVITNIGTAHIGPLGSQEGIAAEKRKIAAGLRRDEALFIYEKEKYFDRLTAGLTAKAIRYGPAHTQGLKGSQDLGLDGTAIDWEGLQIRFPLVGVHNYRNALAALAVAAFLKIPARLVKESLETARPLFGRSQVLRGRITLIQDCYNANPDSMQEALAFLKDAGWPGRKIAVLGSMRELGGSGPGLHRELGRAAGSLGLDRVFFFGEEMREAWRGFEAAGAGGCGEWLGDFEELAGRLAGYVRPGDLVLVKGSRALELERLTPRLIDSDKKGEGA